VGGVGRWVGGGDGIRKVGGWPDSRDKRNVGHAILVAGGSLAAGGRFGEGTREWGKGADKSRKA